MKNKNVGFFILGISIIIGIIVLIFNSALKNIIGDTCSHGLSCEMYSTLAVQTWISLSIAGLIFVIGLFFIFAKEPEKIIIRKVKEKKIEKKIDLKGLKIEERQTFSLIKSQGTIFQADLIEKMGLGKAKMSRILDRLEGKGLVERKRRGLTNVVVFKEN